MGALLWIVVIIGVIGAAAYLLPWQMRVVPEEERWVIHRLGKFSRIGGPGVVYLSSLDTVHHKFNALDKPRNVRIDNLFMRVVPFGYMLNFWYRVDPVAAARGDQEKLAQFSQFDDRERDKLVGTKVREALVYSTTKVGDEYKPAGDAFFYNMLPLIPGLPINDKLLQLTREKLAQTLPTIGIILNQEHPITIAAFSIAPDLIESFNRDRIVTLLREQFPNLPEETMLETVGAIAGIDIGRKRISIDSTGGASVAVDERNGELSTRAFVQNNKQSSPATTKRTPESTPELAPQTRETLSSDDLRVLKQVK